jgi:hypothetical protein
MVFSVSPPIALSDACKAARALTSCAAAVPIEIPRTAIAAASLRTMPASKTSQHSPQLMTVRAPGALQQESATELLLVQNGMLFATLYTGDYERCGALG